MWRGSYSTPSRTRTCGRSNWASRLIRPPRCNLAFVEHGATARRASRKAFITALRLQCGYPCFPRDAEGCCFICHHKCGPSLVHATMCQCPAGNSGRNTRHSHVQHTAVLAIRKAVPACNIAPGNPSYDTYFERRDTSSAAGPIQKADFLLSLVDKDYLVDINISGSAANVVEVAAKTAGAISRAGENRKLKEVTDRYHVAAGSTTCSSPSSSSTRARSAASPTSSSTLS